MTRPPASLRALLANVIDYAGLYPPSALPLEIVEERYRAFRNSPESWMLNRLVLPLAKLAEARLGPDWRITLLADSDPGALPPQVETIETRLPGPLAGLPTYCEVPLAQVNGTFAKVRTGGLTPEAVPSSEQVAQFLFDAAARRIPFKATAGLHHPLRAEQALTYAPDSPRAPMHGFLNVFAAAAFAYEGMKFQSIVELLEERDPAALEFTDDDLRWSQYRIATDQVQAARRAFAHSFGSCSFEEPVTELRNLGLLP
jgi:hypothetical protein